jgi:hypothetical protein
MDYIDKKYVNLLSPKLRNFKWKNEGLANFSCPICGDSQTKKTKARGFVFRHKGATLFKCHNCSVSLPLGKLIQTTDANLYGEYSLERFGKVKKKTHKTEAKTTFADLSRSTVLNKHLVPLTSLNEDHPCKAYVISRKIPKKHHKLLYYAKNFREWVASVKPEKKDSLNEEPRLIIPFFNKAGNEIIAFQGRSLAKNSVQRYVTIKLNDDYDLIFGLERLQWDKTIYVVEGPLDSLFLPNSVAIAGSGKLVSFGSSNEQVCYVYDNERRNPYICNSMKRALDHGFGVCFWPEVIKEKDINDMILYGKTEEQILHIIRTNTHWGMRGHLEISQWRKC